MVHSTNCHHLVIADLLLRRTDSPLYTLYTVIRSELWSGSRLQPEASVPEPFATARTKALTPVFYMPSILYPILRGSR